MDISNLKFDNEIEKQLAQKEAQLELQKNISSIENHQTMEVQLSDEIKQLRRRQAFHRKTQSDMPEIRIEESESVSIENQAPYTPKSQ